jgi:predicted acetyltransferase
VIGEARLLGLAKVLLTCDDDNEPSRRTIERHGGVLEDVRDTDEGVKRRYWITL